jgi:hypothetical protein
VSRIEKDPLQQKLEMANWVLLGVFVLFSLVVMPLKFSLGVLIGGLICIVNFYRLQKNLLSVITRSPKSAKSKIMIKYYIRLAVTAVVLYFIVTSGFVDVVGLLIGLSIVVINIILTTAVMMFMSKKNCLEEVK